MDHIDKKLVETLFENSKTPLKELAATVGLSAPSTSERLKRLEERGVIRGYTLMVAPEQIGYSLRAIVRVRPTHGQVKRVTKLIEQTAEITECDKVTGEDCFVCKIHLKSIEQLDLILDNFSQYAATNSSIVKSSPVKRRLPPL